MPWHTLRPTTSTKLKKKINLKYWTWKVPKSNKQLKADQQMGWLDDSIAGTGCSVSSCVCVWGGVFMWVCTCMCRYADPCIYMWRSRGQHWVFSSVAPPLTFWDRVSQWTWSSPLYHTSWTAKTWDPAVSTVPELRCETNHYTKCSRRCWGLELGSSSLDGWHLMRWAHSPVPSAAILFSYFINSKGN